MRKTATITSVSGNALGSLTFADRRAFVHSVRAVIRRPWRAILWVLWIAAFAYTSYLRMTKTADRLPPANPVWRSGIEDFCACALLAFIGVILIAPPKRLVGGFSSRAEPLFIVRSALPPLLVAGYLQARTTAVGLLRFCSTFGALLVFATPPDVRGAAFGREIIIVLMAMLAGFSLVLPRTLARGWVRSLCIGVGIVVVALAIIPFARDVLQFIDTATTQRLALLLPEFHPGVAVIGRGFAVPLACAAFMTAAFAASLAFIASADDAYPELYQFSVDHERMRETLRARWRGRELDMGEGTASTTRSVTRTRWRGAFAIAWVERLTWSRRTGTVRRAIIALSALAGGLVVGATQQSDDHGIALITTLSVAGNMLIAIGATGGIRLAVDLRRPLWWLGAEPMRTRLMAWTFAPILRDAGSLLCVAIGDAIVSRDLHTAALIAIVGIGLDVLARGAGIAAFALLPNAADQRGPAMFVRLLVCYSAVLPALVAGVIGKLALHSVLLGAACGCLFAAAEGMLLVMFAAWRLDGRVDALAMA
jgi:hypothetical protein